MNSEAIGKMILLSAALNDRTKFAKLYGRLFNENLSLKDMAHVAAEIYLLAGSTPTELKALLERRLEADSENEIDRGAYAWLKDNHPEVFTEV